MGKLLARFRAENRRGGRVAALKAFRDFTAGKVRRVERLLNRATTKGADVQRGASLAGSESLREFWRESNRYPNVAGSLHNRVRYVRQV